jgi:hypothetical protein
MGQTNSSDPGALGATAPGAMDGMNQGPQGIAQGHEGAAVGQALGPQMGMDRAQLGGMAPSAGPPGDNPLMAIIDAIMQAIMGGSGAPTPGGPAGTPPPPGGGPPGAGGPPPGIGPGMAGQ